MAQEQEYVRLRPEVESCGDGLVPLQPDVPKQKILVAKDLVTMNRLFFKRCRYPMLRWLNRALRDGDLEKTVGFPVSDRDIDRNNCKFDDVSYWRIDRNSFKADVLITLSLSSPSGTRVWKGFLQLYCGFDPEFWAGVEQMGSLLSLPAHEGEIQLSSYLIPLVHFSELDQVCEDLWNEYVPGAVMDPKKRNALKLAERLGLSVLYLPIHEANEIRSFIFFSEGVLQVKDKLADKETVPETVVIPENTIVVNLNLTNEKFADAYILHECFHFEFHRLFFFLQQWGSNDSRNIPMREITVSPKDKVSCPVWWMEKQARRATYALALPAPWLQPKIMEERKKIGRCAHAGILYERVGIRLCCRYQCANFFMRARMIQLGHIEAKGSLNWLPGSIHMNPFAFSVDAWRDPEDTFIIDGITVGKLYEEDREFRELMDSRSLIWASGHVVLNNPAYVTVSGTEPELTPWALAHVDQCCLRFKRIYVPAGPGDYVLGRMTCDMDEIGRTHLLLGDPKNQAILNEEMELRKFEEQFPGTFREGFNILKNRAGLTYPDLAELLNRDDNSLQKKITKKNADFSADFLVALALVLKLPERFSKLLFNCAGRSLNERNPRDMALKWILHNYWNQGISFANEYLTTRGYKSLDY